MGHLRLVLNIAKRSDTPLELVGKENRNVQRTERFLRTAATISAHKKQAGRVAACLDMQKLHDTYQLLRNRNGFTLVELVLYIGISSVFLLTVSVLLAALLQARIKNQTIAEVEQQGLHVMQIITQTVRNADTITSPTQGTSAGSLSVNTIIPGLNPTIFDLANGVIRIKEGVEVPVPLTNAHVTASGLSFSNLSRAGTPGTVRIQFILTQSNPEGRNEFDFSKTFRGSATLRQP